ncbi:phage tail domain-containing protein [Lysinibacillus sp. RC79]|uniref:phage tail domain-containing protein n=1 Tax=Lysinibacillus sp. RC79 TaxID=3156296 RepID=UPI00351629F1
MFFFTDKKGERIKYDTESIVALHSNIATPSYDYVTAEVENGRRVVLDRILQPRSIDTKFLLKAYDFHDTYLLRDEFYQLLSSYEELYFHESALPHKRWKVLLNSEAMGEKGYSHASYDLRLLSVDGIAETLGTSLDLQNRKEWDINLWSWGMGLEWDKEYRYEHSSNNFVIDNIGNLAIDPREHELEITIKATASNYLEIKNTTTGDIYRYNGSLTTNDVLVLKGIQSLKNGVSVFKNTNKKLLTLGIGSNQFTVTGGTIASISFDFRFLYM